MGVMAEIKGGSVGIMGGTFDPIHYGHLVAAEAAREAFALDRIIFVPAGIPPHKDEAEVTPARHRYLMTCWPSCPTPILKYPG